MVRRLKHDRDLILAEALTIIYQSNDRAVLPRHEKSFIQTEGSPMTATLSLAFEALPATPAFPMIALAYGGNGNGDNKDDTKVSLSASAEAADTATGGAVTRAVSEAGFKAGAGSKLVIRTGEGTVILLGAGKKVTAGLEAENLGGHAFFCACCGFTQGCNAGA